MTPGPGAQERDGRRAPGWLENEVLAALWAASEPMTPSMVQAILPRDLAYTTVMTVLQRLHAKGLLRRHRAGRAFAYEPVLDAAEFAARQMRTALDRGSDRAAVLQRFLAGLSPDDEGLLHELLDAMGGAADR
ncbi:MAG TPA: BlaI/MecI/CopY family transcriptional regulator [Candidatus Dormibacteraeota bacterium]|nr:BlaI/MecI/CopY family transcriptional regulator [Candidatus Dormibacteraeota bacterium]